MMKEETKYDIRKFSAIILSAGKSERFGTPKALLHFDKNNSFLQKLLFEYSETGIKDIIIVINASLEMSLENQIQTLPPELKITALINPHPEKGRFSSIELAVNAVKKSHLAFIQNIDNPFTTAELLRQMITKTDDCNYVVPVYNGEKGHPVLLSAKILNCIRKMKSSDGNLRELLDKFPSAELCVRNPNILANINTKDDYLKYFSHAAPN